MLGAAGGSRLSAKQPEGHVPTTVEELNGFSQHYNAYIKYLNAGQINLDVWARVKRAWHEMTA